jgi:DNA-binding transcriptional LysR family regulator
MSERMNRQLRHGIDPLRYTRSFLTLVDEMHFGRAARRLNLSQPSLSGQIARLELSLGFLLFRRTGRGITLTCAGSRYAEGMRKAMATAIDSIESAEQSAHQRNAAVRVGFVSAAIFNALPRAMMQFGARFPSVEQALVPRRTDLQIDDLCAGTLDIACVRGPITESGLISATMLREKLFAAVPSAHRLARRREVDLADLRDEAIASFPEAHAEALASVINEAWSSAGGAPAKFAEANDWPAIIAMVGAGAACSVVPESVTALSVPGVKYRPLKNCRLRTDLTVAHRSGDRREHVQWLVSFLAAAA